MITERGTLKMSCSLDANMQKELNSGANKLAIVMLIVGSIGVAVFLVLDIVSIFLETETDMYYVFIVVFAAFLGLGIGLKLIINKNMKTVMVVRFNEYEFFSDHFTINEFMNNELVATGKIYNTQITKARESKNYFFFFINTAVAYPVDKSLLGEAEANTLRGIFRLPLKGGVQPVVLPAEAAQNGEPKGDSNELS